MPLSQQRKSTLTSIAEAIVMIFAVIGFVITISSLFYAITSGNINDLISWLLTHIAFLEVTIEFPFGITLFITFTAGGIAIAIRPRNS